MENTTVQNDVSEFHKLILFHCSSMSQKDVMSMFLRRLFISWKTQTRKPQEEGAGWFASSIYWYQLWAHPARAESTV
jgi:hypothetical protein